MEIELEFLHRQDYVLRRLDIVDILDKCGDCLGLFVGIVRVV